MSYPQYNIYTTSLAKSPKEDYEEEMQAIVDDMFYDSSDWYEIEEERSFASGVYSNLDVRINEAFNPSTGLNRGDDWKKIIFKEIDKAVKIGSLFQFDDNYWLTVNTGSLSTLTSSCIIRRCNNTLRFMDESGMRHKIPCIIDYKIQENRDYASSTSAVVNPSGILQVTSQLNADTNIIRPTFRFLFGNSNNWSSFKVHGGGVNSFLNDSTESTLVEGLLNLTLSSTQYNNDGDDLVLGYADNTEQTYTIDISNLTISGIPTDTYSLDAQVYLNNVAVSRDVEWSSSDEAIVTVSTSGVVTFIAVGSATIGVQLEGNDTVSDTCAVTVNTTPIAEYEIVFSPEDNGILEEESETYTVTLELNGVAQADVFVFAVVSPAVPSANYTFSVVDGNNFTVENVEKYMEEFLVIRATSGIYTKDLDIVLKGVY